MIAGAGRASPSRPRPDLVGPALLLLPALALGAGWGPGRFVGLLLAAVAVAAPVVIGFVRPASGGSARWGLSLPALGLVAAGAPVTPWLELLALLAGLAFLAGFGRSSLAPEVRGRALSGLTLPGLGGAIAFATSLLFVPSAGAVGVAAALVVGTVLLLAYLFAAPEREAELAAVA